MSRENQKQIDFKKSDKEVGSKSFIKKFSEWFKLKIKLNNKKDPVKFFSERDVWMTHLGLNIGFEIDGKNKQYLRPAMIIKKLSNETALVIPATTKIKKGSWFSSAFIKNKKGSFYLNQIKMVDSKRFKYRVEKISESEFVRIKKDLANFLGFQFIDTNNNLNIKNTPAKNRGATSVEIDTNNTNK